MYLIKFIPGFGPLVKEQLGKSCKVVAVEEDIALFEANKLPYMPYANHVYRVLGNYPGKNMGELMRTIIRDTRYIAIMRGMVQGDTFRIQCMQGDTLISPDSAQLLALERNIMSAGLSVHRTRPAHELRVWQRDKGQGLFLMSIDNRGPAQRNLPKGTLRSDLAHMLCLLAKIGPTDDCLDPFCGQGSLPKAMSMYKPHSVTASDTDARLVTPLKGVIGIKAMVANALEHPLPAQSQSVILSDPPWGLYKQQAKLDFLPDMFASFARLLTPDGRCVLLLDRSMPAEQAAMTKGFALHRRYDVLYAGHKAKAILLKFKEQGDLGRV